MLNRTIPFLALAAVAALAAGCGGDRRAAVAGKVTVGGKPLTGGNIRFVSVADSNRVGGGMIKPDGTFDVPDAPVGACKVVVDNSHLDPSQSKAAAMPGVPTPGGMPAGMMGMKGGPSRAPAAPGAGGPKKEDKARMGEAPKTAAGDIPPEMSEHKTDLSAQKFVKLEAGFGKPNTTPLTFEVKAGGNTQDFEVK